jgi:hypothetical protein
VIFFSRVKGSVALQYFSQFCVARATKKNLDSILGLQSFPREFENKDMAAMLAP